MFISKVVCSLQYLLCFPIYTRYDTFAGEYGKRDLGCKPLIFDHHILVGPNKPDKKTPDGHIGICSKGGLFMDIEETFSHEECMVQETDHYQTF